MFRQFNRAFLWQQMNCCWRWAARIGIISMPFEQMHREQKDFISMYNMGGEL